MMKVEISSVARKQLKKLPCNVRERIIRKVYWFSQQDDPLSFAEPLHNSPLGEYRFRVGDYRIFFDLRRKTVTIIEILSVCKRDHAYD